MYFRLIAQFLSIRVIRS